MYAILNYTRTTHSHMNSMSNMQIECLDFLSKRIVNDLCLAGSRISMQHTLITRSNIFETSSSKKNEYSAWLKVETRTRK